MYRIHVTNHSVLASSSGLMQVRRLWRGMSCSPVAFESRPAPLQIVTLPFKWRDCCGNVSTTLYGFFAQRAMWDMAAAMKAASAHTLNSMLGGIFGFQKLAGIKVIRMREDRMLEKIALMMCFFFLNQSLVASEPDASAVKIEKLEALVSVLEKRVSALESPSGQSSATAKNIQNQAAWEVTENWRLLRKGMTKAQVKGLLGAQEKIDAGGPIENWNWGVPVGPRVTFCDEKLYGWKEPD